MILDGPRREEYRNRDGPDPRTGAQQTQPDRANLQYIPRIDRQQRRRPAEQNGEEIERNRAQNDFLFPDIFEPGEDGVPASRLGFPVLIRLGNAGRQDGSETQKGRRGSVGGERLDAIEQTAGNRPEDNRQLPGG